jgi:hypothetical protein
MNDHLCFNRPLRKEKSQSKIGVKPGIVGAGFNGTFAKTDGVVGASQVHRGDGGLARHIGMILRGRHFELQTRNSEPLNPELSISDLGLWTFDFRLPSPHRSSFDAFHSPPPANYEILKCAVFPRLLQICTHRAPKLLPPPPRARIMRTAARDKSWRTVVPAVRAKSAQASRRVERR